MSVQPVTGTAFRLPRCTSPAIALANLQCQLDGLRIRCDRFKRPEDGAALIAVLLTRHGVCCAPGDLVAAETLSAGLVRERPDHPRSWLARADVHGALHQFALSEQALENAAGAGARRDEITGRRADIDEAAGRRAEALRARLALASQAPTYEQHGRIACLHAAEGRVDVAMETFARAVSEYSGPSPFPLSATLFNWGHALEHAGEHERAADACRMVLELMPGHVRALCSLAQHYRNRGDIAAAAATARRASLTAPTDPVSAGILALALRQANDKTADEHCGRASALYVSWMRRYPDVFAARAAGYWTEEGLHPSLAREAAAAMPRTEAARHAQRERARAVG